MPKSLRPTPSERHPLKPHFKNPKPIKNFRIFRSKVSKSTEIPQSFVIPILAINRVAS